MKFSHILNIAALCIILSSSSVFSQSFFEPTTNITGYITTEINAFNDLEGHYSNEVASSISESGILVSHRASEKFTIKGVLVYRPQFNFDQIFNEAYGKYEINSFTNVQVGRFLVPLSYVNTYYYAPVNSSTTLPLIVSNNEFYPLNTDGVSVNGKVGEKISLSYHVFAGGYRNITYLTTGAIGFFGHEQEYFGLQAEREYFIDESFRGTYNSGYGANVTLSLNNIFDFGFSFFDPNAQYIPMSIIEISEDEDEHSLDEVSYGYTNRVDQFSLGFQSKFSLNNTTLSGEYWLSDNSSLNGHGKTNTEGFFVNLNHLINNFTPFVRYEEQLSDDIEYTRLTSGINYKPTFETTVKAEYMLYNPEVGNIVSAFVASITYSF